MSEYKDWDLDDLNLDGPGLNDPDNTVPETGVPDPDDTRAVSDIASSMEEYLRDVEASWNKNLSTPISLDEDVKLYQPPIRAARPAPEPEPVPEPVTEQELPPPEPDEEPNDPEPEDLDEDSEDHLPRFLKVMLYFVCVVLAAILLALGAWLAAEDVLALTKPDRTVTIVVEEGDTMEDIAQTLYDNNLIEYKGLFKLYAWFTNADEKISPGEYELNNQYDYNALVNGMRSSYTLPDTVTVTIPEGYECADIFALLEENGVCDAASLEEAAANYQFSYDFLENLPYGDANRLEGYLFPDTYEFYVDDDPENVLDRFLSNFETKFDDEMLAQMDVLNDWIRQQLDGKTEEEIQDHLMTIEKIVIIASLIEKEAAVSSERTTISSVIHNRLVSDLHPYLEIDATIQYVLEERKEVLTYSDLEIDSPYNTYLYPGLPVGAICNPGLSCLKAALYPSETNYYYYALNSEGTHTFFETSVEHQAFVNSTEYAAAEDSEDAETADTEPETNGTDETGSAEEGTTEGGGTP